MDGDGSRWLEDLLTMAGDGAEDHFESFCLSTDYSVR